MSRRKKMEKNNTLKFNKKIYSPASVSLAAKEFGAAYGHIAFAIRNSRSYTEVDIRPLDPKERSLTDEFCNYALFLNLK